MDTYNCQCLIIQSTSDTGMLSPLFEILFFYLGSSRTVVKIFVGFFLIKSFVYDGKIYYMLYTLFGLSVAVFRAIFSVAGSTLQEDLQAQK